MDTSKIIIGKASVLGEYSITNPIFKEDYGLYLQIEGIELPPTYEVDFSNSEQNGTSVTMIGNADGVHIPNQFVKSGKDIFAFLYHVGEDFGRTVYKFCIPNKVRPDRTDEEPTPEEQSTIDQVIFALNEAVAQTAQDVISADQSAQSAQGYAEQAEAARDTAQTYANNASASATSASESATASANSATASANSASQAEQTKTAVEGMVDDAQGYAQSAEQSAQNAHTYALSANVASGTAENFADVASSYASSAQGSANTASAKAQDASGYAQTASTKASESAQSASQALSYKTDAESAKTASQTAQGLAEGARDSAQGYAEDAQEYAEDAQASAESISASASQIAKNASDILKAFPTDTASGSIASFTDGADGLPLKSLVVNINPVQDLSQGDPSPENICPISGRTGMQLKAMGKNLLDPSLLKNQAAWNIIKIYAPVGTRLTMSTNQPGASTSGLLTYFRIPNGTQGSNENVLSTHPVTKTVGEDGYLEIIQRNRDNIKSYADYEYQIELGSDATAYKPYTGRSIPISWESEAGTVYGGTLDVLSGVMRVTYGIKSFNGGFEKHGSVANAFYKNYAFDDAKEGTVYSNQFEYSTSVLANLTVGKFTIDTNYTRLALKTDAFATKSELNAHLAENPLVVVYPLATPITYQLTPHEVNSLLGQNNIWADTGDCAVEYRADTKLYIEKLTQPEEDDMIADSAISSGQFFMIGNSLYKALTAIASGATITVGTNAQRVSLADALNLVNA